MSTIGRFDLALVIAVSSLGACVSPGQHVELAGVAPSRQGVRSAAPVTIDLLPIESRVTAYPEHRLDSGDAGIALRAAVTAALPPALAAHRYRLASVIDRRGRASVRQAMSAPEVSATRVAFLEYARAQHGSPRRLLAPALPHPLGRATGSRATLFVAGFGIAGDDSTHSEDVLAGLALFQATVATAGVVGGLANNDDGADGATRAVADYADQMASATELLDEAAYQKQFRAPRSHLRLVLTLVDNASGQVIWHSNRVFAGRDPTDPADVRTAVERSLRRMPQG